MLHLSCSIYRMSHAIRSITHLEIHVQPTNESSSEEVAVVLSQLATACPALQHLRVTGELGRAFLATLGASCSKFRCLEVMLGVSCVDMHDLHLILPGLTECRLEAFHLPGDDDDWFPTRDCCLTLLTCTTLTRLDIGTSQPTRAMWQAFPASLKELCCCATYGVTGVGRMNCVTHFSCMCDPLANFVELSCLVEVLRLMPNLKVLVLAWKGDENDGPSISKVFSRCAACIIPDLKYLHNLVCSGLQVSSQMCSTLGVGVYFEGICLSLCVDSDDDDGDEIEDMVEFISLLPPCPEILGLDIVMETCQPSILSLTQSIAAVFPNLQALRLQLPGGWISSRDLQYLGVFTSLQHLFLDPAHVSPAMMAMLCVRLSQLKSIQVCLCPEFTDPDCEELDMLLKDWGSNVKVCVVDDDPDIIQTMLPL